MVDDDRGGRRLTRATLERAGFEVLEAQDGLQALDVMRAELPDLVLMDVSMPVMDGFTACAELRQLPEGGRVPVVMMTGLDDVESIERAFANGIHDLEGLVAYLNQAGPRGPDGGDWTTASFQAEMAQLGQ